MFQPLYNLNTNLWLFTTPNVRTTCRIWKNNYITFLEFLSHGRRSDILLNKIETLLIFDPLITLWGHFKSPYFKMLNNDRVASACLYVRTCQRVRNSKNIATIRDFHLPSSFFCLSTRLIRHVSRLNAKAFLVKLFAHTLYKPLSTYLYYRVSQKKVAIVISAPFCKILNDLWKLTGWYEYYVNKLHV